MQAFLRELVERQSDRDTSARLLLLEQRQSTLAALNDTLFHFTTTFADLHALASPDDQNSFVDRLVESLSTLLLTAADTLRSDDPADRDMLLRMTADRGELMERLRQNLLSGSQPLDHRRKTGLFYLTTLFERAVWLLRQLAQLSSPGHRA